MKELAEALAKAQAEIGGAKKGAVNAHFKNKYADLSSVWEAWQEVGPKHGLSIVQFGYVKDSGAVLVTRLMHTSGQHVDGEIPLLHKPDMQGLGSALTYARRYGLAAMVGICPEDDDGNAAGKPDAVPPKAPEGYAAWSDSLVAASKKGLDALKAAWSGDEAREYRVHFAAIGSDLDALKAVAAQTDKESAGA